MKKKLMRLLSIAICTALVSSSQLVTQAATSTDVLESKLAPYQAVIDKLNHEYNASISIENANLEEVYDNVMDMSVEEFEVQTKAALIEAVKSPHYISFNANESIASEGDNNSFDKGEPVTIPNTDAVVIPKDNKSLNSVILLKNDSKMVIDSIISRNVNQTFTWSQGSVFINSDIDVTNGVISYSSVYSVGYNKMSGNHIRVSRYTHVLLNSNRNCKVTYSGSLYSGSGLNLGVAMTVTITYTAGGGSIGEVI